jgi:hypothetical protein
MIQALIFILVGVFLSYKKPHLALVIIILHNFILMWFSLKFNATGFSIMGTSGVLLIYLLSAVYFVKFKIIYLKYIRFLSFFYLGFSLHMIVISIYHGQDLSSYLLYFRNYFHYFLLIPLVLTVFETKKWKIPLIFIASLVLLQILLTFGQMIFPSLKGILFVEFLNRGNGFERQMSETVVLGNTTVGTFIRPANLGNFLAIVIPFIFYLYQKNIFVIRKVFFYIIFFLLIFVLLRTGIRTAFVSFIVMFLGTLFVTNKAKFFSILLISYLVLTIGGTIIMESVSSYSKSDGFENPILRIALILNPLVENSSLIENSTLSRSNNILSYTDNIIFGNSIYISGGYYKGISSITDATLGFIFVEFGIITFFLAFIPFLFPLKILFKNRKSEDSDYKYAVVLFLGILTQTITDQGFFTAFLSIPYFVIMGILISRKKNRETK